MAMDTLDGLHERNASSNAHRRCLVAYDLLEGELPRDRGIAIVLATEVGIGVIKRTVGPLHVVWPLIKEN